MKLSAQNEPFQNVQTCCALWFQFISGIPVASKCNKRPPADERFHCAAWGICLTLLLLVFQQQLFKKSHLAGRYFMITLVIQRKHLVHKDTRQPDFNHRKKNLYCQAANGYGYASAKLSGLLKLLISVARFPQRDGKTNQPLHFPSSVLGTQSLNGWDVSTPGCFSVLENVLCTCVCVCEYVCASVCACACVSVCASVCACVCV